MPERLAKDDPSQGGLGPPRNALLWMRAKEMAANMGRGASFQTILQMYQMLTLAPGFAAVSKGGRPRLALRRPKRPVAKSLAALDIAGRLNASPDWDGKMQRLTVAPPAIARPSKLVGSLDEVVDGLPLPPEDTYALRQGLASILDGGLDQCQVAQRSSDACDSAGIWQPGIKKEVAQRMAYLVGIAKSADAPHQKNSEKKMLTLKKSAAPKYIAREKHGDTWRYTYASDGKKSPVTSSGKPLESAAARSGGNPGHYGDVQYGHESQMSSKVVDRNPSFSKKDHADAAAYYGHQASKVKVRQGPFSMDNTATKHMRLSLIAQGHHAAAQQGGSVDSPAGLGASNKNRAASYSRPSLMNSMEENFDMMKAKYISRKKVGDHYNYTYASEGGAPAAKVIGETRSGKKIHTDGSNTQGFSHQDHADAYHAHQAKSEHHFETVSFGNPGKKVDFHTKMANHHYDLGQKHYKAAGERMASASEMEHASRSPGGDKRMATAGEAGRIAMHSTAASPWDNNKSMKENFDMMKAKYISRKQGANGKYAYKYADSMSGSNTSARPTPSAHLATSPGVARALSVAPHDAQERSDSLGMSGGRGDKAIHGPGHDAYSSPEKFAHHYDNFTSADHSAAYKKHDIHENMALGSAQFSGRPSDRRLASAHQRASGAHVEAMSQLREEKKSKSAGKSMKEDFDMMKAKYISRKKVGDHYNYTYASEGGGKSSKVIGETRSGKKIHTDGSNTQGYSRQDHSDAYAVHMNRSGHHEERREAANSSGSASSKTKASFDRHDRESTRHGNLAQAHQEAIDPKFREFAQKKGISQALPAGKSEHNERIASPSEKEHANRSPGGDKRMATAGEAGRIAMHSTAASPWDNNKSMKENFDMMKSGGKYIKRERHGDHWTYTYADGSAGKPTATDHLATAQQHVKDMIATKKKGDTSRSMDHYLAAEDHRGQAKKLQESNVKKSTPQPKLKKEHKTMHKAGQGSGSRGVNYIKRTLSKANEMDGINFGEASLPAPGASAQSVDSVTELQQVISDFEAASVGGLQGVKVIDWALHDDSHPTGVDGVDTTPVPVDLSANAPGLPFGQVITLNKGHGEATMPQPFSPLLSTLQFYATQGR